MTTYKNIHGRSIQSLATDPTESSAEGQIWYNTTSDTFKTVVALEAWSSGSPMITARRLMASSSSGPQTAALGVGGYIDGTGDTAITEEYNGSGFSTGTSINTARREFDGAGTQTATVVMGGRIGSNQQRAETEEFNGTSWSEQNDLNTGRQRLSGAGIQTAALAFAGITDTDATEEYNGTSWTAANNMGSGTYGQGGSGTQTAALSCGGNPYRTTTEEYDGTNWATVNSLNTGRMFLRASGTQTTTLAFGGKTPPSNFSAVSESYDGTTWTNTPSLANAVAEQGRGGGNSAGISFGGFTPGVTSRSEEFTRSTNTITAAAWASGGTMNTGRTALGGTGITTAALGMGGGAPLNVQTEEYNGSSWTSTNNINVGRAIYGGAFGPQGAAGAASGEPTSSPAGSSYEEYDGSNWTAGPSLNIARNGGISLGTQTAALCVAGFTGPAAPNSYIKTSESWNGSSWTSLPSPGSDTQTAGQGSSAGTTAAGLIFGRYDGAPNYTGKTDEYDGSSWTVGGVMITARYATAGSGAQTAAMVSQGYSTGTLNVAEGYDGTAWSTRPNCSVGKYQVAGAGASNTDCISFGGSGNSTATEEFTGETTAVNVKTLTQS